MPSISYAITACNEHVELERLLNQLDSSIRDEDEIIIQLDVTATEEVKKIASTSRYKKLTTVITIPLNRDFASFKNHLKGYCTKEYIFQIDADEYLSDQLIQLLPEILELNPEVELYAVPRVNTVEGLTQEHIQKWGWNVDENGWVNYPDYQIRICKNNKDINWEGKVHEKLTSPKSYILSPLPVGYELIHPKTIERQEIQNNFYEQL